MQHMDTVTLLLLQCTDVYMRACMCSTQRMNACIVPRPSKNHTNGWRSASSACPRHPPPPTPHPLLLLPRACRSPAVIHVWHARKVCDRADAWHLGRCIACIRVLGQAGEGDARHWRIRLQHWDVCTCRCCCGLLRSELLERDHSLDTLDVKCHFTRVLAQLGSAARRTSGSTSKWW